MNEPRNHHYVPQHFLKAWESRSKKIIRYRTLPLDCRVEVREVSIKSTASQEDLYRLEFKDGSFEIESSIMTPKIDYNGSCLLNLVRSGSIDNLNNQDKIELFKYFVNLEARHPDVIKEMDISSDLDVMRSDLKSKKIGSDQAVDDVINYLSDAAPDTLGVMAFGFLSQFGFGFAEKIFNGYSIELIFEEDVLLTSSYPVARNGNYVDEYFFVIAISPRKAFIFSNSKDVVFFDKLAVGVRADLINLFTLAKADAAYFRYKHNSISEFVEKHLGWGKSCKTNDERRRYINSFLEQCLAK